MAGERWTFTKSQLVNTPSRKCGVDIDKELSYRQQAANLIQDMGQRLQTNQLCINTAIVYMHRFYMFHSFTKFNRNVMSPACLFLAAKVEEQPRKLEHVIKTSHTCLREGSLDTKSEAYLEHAQELIINENILLQSLGFEVRVDHPHTTVVTTCQLVRASKDLAQTSYFLATNSLHLTTMCLQQKPNVVACVCIHLACKWSGYEIPSSHEGKSWFSYVDKNVTMELLEELTQDFLNILDKCPSRLKKKIMTWRSGKGTTEDDKLVKSDGSSSSKAGETSKNVKPESSHARNLFEDSQAIISETISADGGNRSQQSDANTSSRLADVKSAHQPSHASMNPKDYKQHKEYKERKEKDRLVGHAASTSSSGNKSHGNGDVKRSQNQYSRVDSDRKATQSVYDGIHHISREDPNKRPDLNVKRQHDSPLKMTIKSNRDDKGPKSNETSLSKTTKRSHQSDNEMSDSSDRSSKHRRSETHPIVSDNSFSTGTINHSDLFSGQTSYLGIPPPMSKIDTGNGSSGSDRHSKTAYVDASTTSGVNADRSLWSNVKSPVNQHVKTSLGSSSRKDRSIFSPLQPPSSHHPPPPVSRHLIQGQSVQRNIPQTGPRVLPKSSQGNMNASFDQSYQHGGHPAVYPQYTQSMMPNAYQDNTAVTGMNSNGGSLQNPNLNQELMGDTLAQLQHLITHQKYQIAATQQAQQIHTNHQPPMSSHQPSMSSHQPSMSSIFDIDLLDTDLGVMPPLPPPLPQSNAPQPPPPPF